MSRLLWINMGVVEGNLVCKGGLPNLVFEKLRAQLSFKLLFKVLIDEKQQSCRIKTYWTSHQYTLGGFCLSDTFMHQNGIGFSFMGKLVAPASLQEKIFSITSLHVRMPCDKLNI